MKKKNNYDLKALVGLAITFVVVTIVIAFGSTILQDIKDDQTENDSDYNATEKGLEAMTTFADWLPTLALIVIAAVIIGIIVRYFAFGGA